MALLGLPRWPDTTLAAQLPPFVFATHLLPRPPPPRFRLPLRNQVSRSQSSLILPPPLGQFRFFNLHTAEATTVQALVSELARLLT